MTPLPAAPTLSAPLPVEALYREFSRRLEQIVRLGVRAPEPVIEDACQFAWSKLVHHRERVRRETVLPWLVTTATREALRLVRRDRRELSLEEELERASAEKRSAAPSPMAMPEERLEYRERLAEMDRLPERQQRLLWLHAFGFSYVEMAVYEGYTRRTVERQLLRAKRAVRERPLSSRSGAGASGREC